MASFHDASAGPADLAVSGLALKSKRHEHITQAIRLGAFVLIGQGILWCVVFGMTNVPIGVALHASFVAGGFSLLYCLAIGARKVALHLTFWLMFAYCLGTQLFFDNGGHGAWPKVTHLYLLPIALGINLVFMDERPFWRVVYSAICIIAFVVIERQLIAIPTIVVLPNWDAIEAFVTLFNTIVAVFLTFILLRRFAGDVAVREDQLSSANSSIEGLLEHMLPHKILQRLRDEQSTFADEHRHVSIMFADIVGFTQLASQTEPQALVNLLNELFSRFDQLVDFYGVEKIKTIGDAYMAVAGIPEPRPDHALALARLGTAMLEVIEDYPQLRMRIGINSGHVIAGIIGRKRFIYDLWGDAVNVAASMESHGSPSRIHVSEATRAELGDQVELEFRGMVDIRSRGPMPTYFIVRPEASQEPPA